jgi:translation initiation factor IF-3
MVGNNFGGGKKKFGQFNNSDQKNRINHQIRISPILLIGENGEKIGTVPIGEALRRAEDAGLDLVEIAPNVRPPVCKILNYSKFKYEQSKKEKEAKNKKTAQLKELRLTPRIESNDVMVKCKHARDFLQDGHKVQLVLKFKNRELAHKELGFDVMKQILSDLDDTAVSTGPKMNGNTLICLLEPKEIKDKAEKNQEKI